MLSGSSSNYLAHSLLKVINISVINISWQTALLMIDRDGQRDFGILAGACGWVAHQQSASHKGFDELKGQ
jgi:hypothetical protein